MSDIGRDSGRVNTLTLARGIMAINITIFGFDKYLTGHRPAFEAAAKTGPMDPLRLDKFDESQRLEGYASECRPRL